LRESGGEMQTRTRHAEYYLALAEPELGGTRQGEWLDRLESEHDNFRAALGWSLEGGDAGLGLRLAGVLGEFWYKRGYLGEGRLWLERELAAGSVSPALQRAKAFDEAGWMALYQGDLERSAELLREGLALFKELEDEPSVAASLFNLGHVVLHQDDREYLTALCEEAETLRRTFADQRAIGELIIFLGMVALYEGDHGRSVALLEESLRMFREPGDEPSVASGHDREGRRDGSAESIEVSAAVELVVGQAQEYLWLAVLEQGNHARATKLLGEELRSVRELGNKPKITFSLLGMAAIDALEGRPARAARLWVAAEALREEIGLALVLWDHTVTDYEAILADARGRLGETAWQEAQNDGRDMTLEQVIEYALAGESGPSPADQEYPSAPSDTYPAGLSAREVDVLKLVARGLTNAQVAKELFISPNTVNRHLNSIYHKLGVSSRAAATRFAIETRLMAP